MSTVSRSAARASSGGPVLRRTSPRWARTMLLITWSPDVRRELGLLATPSPTPRRCQRRGRAARGNGRRWSRTCGHAPLGFPSLPAPRGCLVGASTGDPSLQRYPVQDTPERVGGRRLDPPTRPLGSLSFETAHVAGRGGAVGRSPRRRR